MHEQSIARNIIREAQKHGKVRSIVVEVGDLAHLPADEMQQVLGDLTDWEITIVSKPALTYCQGCQYLGAPEIVEHLHDHSVFKCAECGAMYPDIREGGEIVLKEVEINE